MDGDLNIRTDFQISPTGYPFKLVSPVNGHRGVQRAGLRGRFCDLGYLRQVYLRRDEQIGYRCPAEPVESYLKKGGCQGSTSGKQCLCNGLMATIGLGQIREDGPEMPIVTAGEDFSFLSAVIQVPRKGYSARDVLRYIQHGKLQTLPKNGVKNLDHPIELLAGTG